MQHSMSEILDMVEKAPTLDAKVDILRKVPQPLVHVLQAAFDDRIVFLLPEGAVPFTPSQSVDVHGALFHEARKLYLFVKGGLPGLKQARREMLWIQLLESIHPRDAELLCRVKDKQLPTPSLTWEVFRAAFPKLDVVHDPNKKVVPVVEKTEAPTPPQNIAWNDVPPAAVLFGEEAKAAEQKAVEDIITDAANAVLAEAEPPKRKRGRPKKVRPEPTTTA